jgi:basic membrane protein A and related proteins
VEVRSEGAPRVPSDPLEPWPRRGARQRHDKDTACARSPACPSPSLATGALILSACGGDDEAADFKACQITDTGGIDDRSFNQTVWEGFLRAEEELGVEVKYLESTSESDYDPNIQAFIDEGCDVIVTVGFLLGDATEAFAIANPGQAFGIIDYAYETAYDNLLAMVFDTDQAGFLAGYVAAGMTETGIVGTWGGINIPPVSVFMDGYLAGVNHYNSVKGTSVQVLGWDGSDGVFIGSFESQDLGNSATADMLQNGADIILPVAGPAGLGAATAIQDFGSGQMIWVDTDGYFSTDFGSITLTSVEKKMDNATFDLIRSVVRVTSPAACTWARSRTGGSASPRSTTSTRPSRPT